MKVVLGTFSAVSLLGGGVEVQVRSLQRELKALGVDAELFDPWRRYSDTEVDLFHIFGANVGTYHLGRAISTLGKRLVVSPVFYSRRSPAGVARRLALARRLRRAGGVWTEHMFCKELCDMAQLVLPNTDAEMTMLNQAFGIDRARMLLLPNGTDEHFASATPDLFVREYGVRDFILYAGHIGWERKNVLRLIQALAGIDRPAVFIGRLIDTPYGRSCREAMGASDRIIHIPALTPSSELLASAYAACAVFCLPSYYETPGLAALEAAAAGARICITRYGGTTEYFGDMADYFEPSDVASIRNALRAALRRPASRRLSEHVLSNYLWRHAGQRLMSAYQTLK